MSSSMRTKLDPVMGDLAALKSNLEAGLASGWDEPCWDGMELLAASARCALAYAELVEAKLAVLGAKVVTPPTKVESSSDSE